MVGVVVVIVVAVKEVVVVDGFDPVFIEIVV